MNGISRSVMQQRVLPQSTSIRLGRGCISDPGVQGANLRHAARAGAGWSGRAAIACNRLEYAPRGLNGARFCVRELPKGGLFAY